jgi:hypothetical protein
MKQSEMSLACCLIYVGTLLVILLSSEHGGSKFFRNVCKTSTALHVVISKGDSTHKIPAVFVFWGVLCDCTKRH